MENSPSSARLPLAGILVSDFDGTISRKDFFDLVRARWPIPRDEDPWERYVAGEITHFQALARIFSRIRCTEAELLALVDQMEVDPCFASTVHELQRRGWEVVVASAGCAWYIEQLLAGAGVSIRVFSNPGTFHPETGLVMSLPPASPFFDPGTGVNKLEITRDALHRSDCVAFAGDGRPDIASSLLVPAERRFARGWLAEELTARKEGFVGFDSWTTIRDTLLC